MSVADKITALSSILANCVNGKRAIAQAITAKGVQTDETAPFSTLASNISAIPSGGTDTSDATATADDIVRLKTAYVTGEKVTGTLGIANGTIGTGNVYLNSFVEDIDINKNNMNGSWQFYAHVIRKGYLDTNQLFRMPIGDSDYFGNAVADDVRAGVTFTSSAGIKVTGTASSGGSLPAGISALDFGNIVVNSAFTTSRQTFNHRLGVTPDLMIVYSPSNIATTYSMLAAIRGSVFGWRSSSYNSHMAYHGNSTTNVSWTNSSSTSYGISNMTATTFQLASSGSSYYWRAGTYKYIAIKFS